MSTGDYTTSTLDAQGEPVIHRINRHWVQLFMDRFNIVCRVQSGKLTTSPEREQHMEMTVAHHLGKLFREFTDGQLDEDMVENVDETHFIINMDNGRTLGFQGDQEVQYADVVSGVQGMIMIVRMFGSVFG
ncbi:hypothetical protein R1flu_010477 [Riccia fluitans]|uniref:Uncharacterized protein n=1 Tax=Riccia fluitans TaxID=41844 RepID=A0ABD1Z5V9_9MARC